MVTSDPTPPDADPRVTPRGVGCRAVLLLHVTPSGRHYDWMVEPPAWAGGAADGLWTARVEHPAEAWAALGAWAVTPLPPHRRVYLTKQGPLGGGRGHVRRVAAGRVEASRWDGLGWAGRVTLGGFDAWVRVDTRAGRAHVTAPPGGAVR